jgi:predicted glycogen debranching enzyme
MAIDGDAEWLEPDASGGFASGTVGGARTRRYHALLLTATNPPTGRVVLVNGFEAWTETAAGRTALTAQRYAPDLLVPAGGAPIADFRRDPWPCWTLRLPDGTGIAHEILVDRPSGETLLRWRRVAGDGPCRLSVRPLLSGRDYHALHRENPGFDFGARIAGGNVAWRPYPGMPAIAALTNGTYRQAPDWYRNFLYTAEQARGLDCVEDLATPGIFAWDLAADDAVLVLRAGDGLAVAATERAARMLADEAAARAALGPPLRRAADCYLVDRGAGRTVLAGFPWFTDWGRDTFIAMRGLTLADPRPGDAERILLAWSDAVSEGMLPNRFPDAGDTPEYNSVDASLWFVVAVHEFIASRRPAAAVHERLREAVGAILQGYSAGTRYHIAMDEDGLLAAGEPGVQLTWMDARIGDRVITPRIGKPVEVQALWINALRIAGAWDARWNAIAGRATATFLARFPNPANGGLFDVVDADHVPGACDGKLRPNQIFAVGGLPFPIVTGAAARRIVDLVEAHLLTPIGLRSLAPGDPDYIGRYRGDPLARDSAYHQGTVWPWLLGPFVAAWLAVRGGTADAKTEARARFLPPLHAHLETAGLGHVSEVADGDAPHTPGGCPFQAWSLGELIRIEALLA